MQFYFYFYALVSYLNAFQYLHKALVSEWGYTIKLVCFAVSI